MKLSLKQGVLFQLLVPQMVLANQIVTYIFDQFGYPTVITSGTDGVHGGSPVDGDTVDPHYVVKALDYRTAASGIPDATIVLIRNAIQSALGAQYFVLKESNHIHVQFGLPKAKLASSWLKQLAKILHDDPFA